MNGTQREKYYSGRTADATKLHCEINICFLKWQECAITLGYITDSLCADKEFPLGAWARDNRSQANDSRTGFQSDGNVYTWIFKGAENGVFGSNFGQKTEIMNEIIRGFPQYLHKNLGTSLNIVYDRLVQILNFEATNGLCFTQGGSANQRSRLHTG
jgi:hypothetical protein